jgi:hypothetical protein
MQDSCSLTSYVLRDWETILDVESDIELNDIQFFLEDLRSYRNSGLSLSKDFFDYLNAINVGPIRSYVAGSCLLEELDSIIRPFFDGHLIAGTWRESFEELIAVSSPKAVWEA